jgi:hypothetical protein
MARVLPRLLVPVLLIAAACSPASDGAAAGGRNDTTQHAAAPSAVRDTAQAREEVLRLEKELFQSLVKGDTAPPQRILAEDYVGVSGDGKIETRAQAVAARHRDTTSARGFVPDDIQLDSTTVRVYGDAALALVRATARGRSGGQRMTAPIRNSDVFVWRGGRWQLVSSHLSQIR